MLTSSLLHNHNRDRKTDPPEILDFSPNKQFLKFKWPALALNSDRCLNILTEPNNVWVLGEEFFPLKVSQDLGGFFAAILGYEPSVG